MNILESYLNNNKIDIYNLIFDNFDDIRITLNPSFVIFLRKEIITKYDSINNFARKIQIKVYPKSDYTPLQNYIKDSYYRSAIPLIVLKKIAYVLQVPKKRIYKNIISFSKGSGKRVILPRYIQIDEDFIYGIGLYLAEGKNIDKGKRRVAIANTEKCITNFSIYWLTKYFNIQRKDLKFFVSAPLNCNNDELKQALIKNLQTTSDKLFVNNNKFAKLVAVQVFYDSIVIRKLIDQLKENIIPLCFKKKLFGIKFLQGVFDGEGCVKCDTKKRAVQLILEMKNPLVLNALRFILHQYGIDAKRSEYVIYTATRDYFKIKELQPFRFNIKNKKKFLDSEKTIKRLQTFRNGLFFELLAYMGLNKENSFKSDELYKLIGRKGRANSNFLSAIRRAIDLNLIYKNGKGHRWDPYEHIITEKGIKFVSKEKLARTNHYNCLKANIYNSLQSRWKNGG